MHLFNDDDTIKEYMLVVPSKYKDMYLSQYKLYDNVEVKYVDYSCTYGSLGIYDDISYTDPIILVSNSQGYSPMHLLLSKDQTIEEYQKLVSPYIDGTEMNIKDANREVVRQWLYVLPIILESLFYIILFIYFFIMIIYIFMKIYFEQYNKEIAVKNLLGYRFLETYYSIYVVHLMAYILPLILVYFMLNDMQVLILFFVMTFGFDFIVQTILLNINHRKSKLMLLKDGE